MSGFVKLNRDSELLASMLKKGKHNEFILLTVISLRARRTDDPVSGLKSGEAMVGDFQEIGLTRQNYRTALKNLVDWKILTINPTKQGTIAKLVDSTVYDINEVSDNAQPNQQLTNSQPSVNQQLTTNKNDKNLKKEKNKKPSCELFEKFWTETAKAWFGERGTKSEALKEFQKLSPDQEMTEKLIQVAKSQGAQARRKQSDEGFAPNMKHACRWLKHGCWDVSDAEQVQAKADNVFMIPGCYRDANGNWRGYGT